MRCRFALNEVDRMLERAKEVTRRGKYTYVEYARYADDLVILVDVGFGQVAHHSFGRASDT
jgi:hypothetical protein